MVAYWQGDVFSHGHLGKNSASIFEDDSNAHPQCLEFRILESCDVPAKSLNNAMYLQRQNNGNWALNETIRKEFEAAIQFGKKGEYYGAALFCYGKWIEERGKADKDENGNWSRQPDFVRALEVYGQFLKEFKKGENEHFDEVEQRVKNITNTELWINVHDVFLPDSEIQFTLDWRNIKQVALSIYSVDLTKDFKVGPQSRREETWLEAISLGDKKSQLSWKPLIGGRTAFIGVGLRVV